MGERLVTSVFLLTLTAIIVRNGREVSDLISAMAAGTGGVINVLLTGSRR